MEIDLLISNATIIDGTGQPGYRGDVAIRGGQITALGEIAGRAGRQVDATGWTLLPGLIDPHSHGDLIFTLPAREQAELLAGKITQGITTTLVGNCGLGVAPFSRASTGDILREINGWMSPAAAPAPWPWRSLAEYLRLVEDQGPAINLGTLVPHGPIRIEAMGMARGEPSAAQSRAMRGAVDRALREGAFGLSTGLIYPPGMFSSPTELTELARVVARHDRVYTSHIRGSSETLIPAVEELIEIGRQTGVRVHHSHNEAVGRTHWSKIDQVLRIEEAAVAEGVRLSFDMFPYTAAATMMIAIYPPWALEGGVPALLERLRDPQSRRKIGVEIERHRPVWPPWRDGGWPHNLVRATSWEAIRIGYVESRRHKRLQGINLVELGRLTGKSPFDAISDLIIAEEGRVSMLLFEVSGEERSMDFLERLVRHRLSAFCTDADDYGHGVPHPAAYGAFARLLRLASGGLGLRCEEIVHRMTLYPAQIFGLQDRGVIRPGACADLVLIEPDAIRDRATFHNPRRRATGVRMVIINGSVVYQGGEVSPGHGQVLRAA